MLPVRQPPRQVWWAARKAVTGSGVDDCEVVAVVDQLLQRPRERLAKRRVMRVQRVVGWGSITASMTPGPRCGCASATRTRRLNWSG